MTRSQDCMGFITATDLICSENNGFSIFIIEKKNWDIEFVDRLRLQFLTFSVCIASFCQSSDLPHNRVGVTIVCISVFVLNSEKKA